jgi:hypothetical protein
MSERVLFAIAKKQLDSSDFRQGRDYLENYMVRRYLAGEPANCLGKAFPSLWKDIDSGSFSSSLASILLQRNYPSDRF